MFHKINVSDSDQLQPVWSKACGQSGAQNVKVSPSILCLGPICQWVIQIFFELSRTMQNVLDSCIYRFLGWTWNKTGQRWDELLLTATVLHL